MLSELSQEQLLPRLQVLVYSLAAVAISILIYDQYRQGLYSLVLSNCIAIPALLFSAIFIYINRDRDAYAWINYPLICLLAGLGLYQLLDYPVLMTHYLYAFPLFSYFCLPINHGTWFNVAIALAMTVLVWLDEGALSAIRSGTNYSLLVGSAWCYAYLTQLKGWSLQRLALTDQISGAYNRSHFHHVLEREIARGESARQHVSLIGLVLEEYHQLADLHGNRSVSQFLPRFVTIIQQQVRAEDEMFRLGDDLFVLVLPNCAEEGAIVLLERIKRKLEGQIWRPFAELSLGAAAVTRQPHEASEALEQRLMGRLKKQKRTSLQLAAFSE
jgi:diguanylate cyclase (GGDEF)-like protein